jgi:hypothetical protein
LATRTLNEGRPIGRRPTPLAFIRDPTSERGGCAKLLILAFESCSYSYSYSGRSPVLVLKSARQRSTECAARPNLDGRSFLRFSATSEYEYRFAEYEYEQEYKKHEQEHEHEHEYEYEHERSSKHESLEWFQLASGFVSSCSRAKG